MFASHCLSGGADWGMAMIELLILIVFMGVFFGTLGALIAKYRGASGAFGFLLGAILGPIGCLIAVFLRPHAIPNQAATRVPSPPSNKDLDNAQYRLWLVRKYAIERNEVLGEVICGNLSFSTVDEALKFAHEYEESKQYSEELNNVDKDNWIKSPFLIIMILVLLIGSWLDWIQF
jgi:hypothetical protein